jgi:hypothetical protein
VNRLITAVNAGPRASRRWLGGCLAAAVLAVIGMPIEAAVGFLGTGGGQWQLTQADPAAAGSARTRFTPLACGAAPCILDIRIVGATDSRHPQGMLYRTGFAVQGRSNLDRCNGVQGAVDGARIDLGRCGAGEFVSVNEVKLRQPGRAEPLHWVFDFVPDLASGVWVDAADPRVRFSFEGGRKGSGAVAARGCEAGPRGIGKASIVVSLSNYRDFARHAGTVSSPPLRPATTVRQLLRADGSAWSGEFVGVSGLVLRSGGAVMRLERRNLPRVC